MATTKRERQKAARQQRLARMQRDAKRRKFIRRGVIVVIAGAVIVVSAAYLFAGSTPVTTTTTTSVTTTTLAPVTWAPVKDPSAAGTWGKAPTLVVPPGSPPTTPERSDLISGTGAIALKGDSLTVEYELATYSTRKVIQSSWTSTPFTISDLGVTGLIAGWTEGLVGVRQGTRLELILPPSLGYGSTAEGGGIAANDTLVFIIDVQKVS